MDRRTLLSSVASGVATLAGCLTDAGPDTEPTADGEPTADEPTDGPTDDPTTTTETPDYDVVVWDVEVQYGTVIPFSPDSIGLGHEEGQVCFARLHGDPDLDPEDIALTVGDRSIAPTRLETLYRTKWADDDWYGDGASTGLLCFEIPADVSAPDARLTWPGGEHPLDDAQAARVGNPPPEWAATLAVPETVPATQERLTVTVSITNEGAQPARFVGALNRQGPTVAYTPEGPIRTVVPAGETVEVEVPSAWYDSPPEERIGDGDPDVTYGLDYVGGGDSAEIRVVDGEEADGTPTA